MVKEVGNGAKLIPNDLARFIPIFRVGDTDFLDINAIANRAMRVQVKKHAQD